MRRDVVIAVLLCSGVPLWAWPGHNYEEWAQQTQWRRPEVTTDQAGKATLTPLLAVGQEPGHIDEIRAWEAKRETYAKAIMAVLGEPTDLKVLPVEVQTLDEDTLDDHVRRHIRIRSEADDWIPAYLLLPRGKSTARAAAAAPPMKRLAMICIHQTVAWGKREPCGLQGDPEMAFALELVRQGYVCIAPDMIGFGERIPEGTRPYHDSAAFYRRHPKWSFMGKMIWDVSRLVDYLETLPEVDPRQIGSIGHSHGAYTTLFAAAFEPRIAAAVASCGFTTFRSDPQPDRWSHLTALIPQMGMYLPDVAAIPFDWQHICAMIAPRPLFVWYATQDAIFPKTDDLDDLFKDVRQVYGLYGAADDLAWRAFDGPHRFPADGRHKAYAWLGERLFPIGDLHMWPHTLPEWQRHRDLIRRVIRRSIGKVTSPPVPLDVQVLARETVGSYERWLIEYTVEPGQCVRAYLCVPIANTGLLPGVLVLHQTTAEGKRESVGIVGDRSLAFGADLAARGFVTLSPDSIAAGERTGAFEPFDTRVHYTHQSDVSAMGKMLHDARVALDVLAATPGVDADRLGAIGHSLGAEEALMLAAFDERVRATVASCGYATFAAEKERLRWARDAWFSYMPKLRPVFQQGRVPAWDWGEVLALIAPRGLFQHTTENDPIFTESRSAFEAGERARAVWAFYGKGDRLMNVLKPGQHAVADDTKAEMYRWLDEQLGGQ